MNNELTAALLSIEKSKEASGCPAGVDLQDWVKQLAAENVGLKQQEPKAWYIRMTDEVTTDSGEAKMWLGVPLVLAGIETPATDSMVARIKADGVVLAKSAFEMHIQSPSCYQDEMVGMESALSIACQVESQLREGAGK